MSVFRVFPFIGLLSLAFVSLLPAAAPEGFRNVWTEAPKRIPSNSAVDAPLLGNGDVLATVGYRDEKLTWYLGKNDFWRLRSQSDNLSGPRVAALLEISGDAVSRAAFTAEQSLTDGATECRLSKEECELTVRGFVSATENVIVLELLASKETHVTLKLTAPQHQHAECRTGEQDGVSWITREYLKDVDIPTKVAVAMRTLDGQPSALTLRPGVKTTVVLAMKSLFGTDEPLEKAQTHVRELDGQRLEKLAGEHKAWWNDYWNRSTVVLDDPVLLKAYYQGLYTMAACSRDPKFPPNIFGWVTTDTPAWNGDYHLNYNHNAPFYAMYGANRIEQGDPEDAPLLDFMPRGRWYAENVTHVPGILYPVGIGPLGIETTRNHPRHRDANSELEGLFFQQRSNAAYGVVNMAQRWRCTYDPQYGEKIYPYVLAVVDFWEGYLKFEDGRYVVYGDAIHEGSGRNKNPILTLGLIRNTFEVMLDLSETLDRDAGRREKWRHVLDHLSAYTYQQRNGKNVFRYTEEGTAWWNGNGLGIQQIYPGNAITLDSPPELLEVARNTIDVMGRWFDFNTTSSFYVAAIRVGYAPDTVWKKLGEYALRTYPNGFQSGNPHGIENAAVVANAVGEMLCMSAGHRIRLFAGLPEGHDAQFANLRAWGAFLISARRQDGVVSDVRIVSQQGRRCTLVNPWPGKEVTLVRDGSKSQTLSGETLSFDTRAGEMIELQMKNT